MRMYKTLKDLPTHKEGSILVESDGVYSFVTSPWTKYTKVEVEEYPEWFELMVDDWENGETFFYLSTDFEIVEKEFNSIQHYKLVLNGNAFKDKETARWLKDKLNILLTDDDMIITDNGTIMSIVSNIKSKNVDKAVKSLMALL